MLEKGYKIIGQKCDGRCGKKHSSGLFMRKAVPLNEKPSVPLDPDLERLFN